MKKEYEYLILVDNSVYSVEQSIPAAVWVVASLTNGYFNSITIERRDKYGYQPAASKEVEPEFVNY